MTIAALILDLDSVDSSVRDRAALELMDRRATAAVEPLLRAIARLENVDHRGTLVYALGAFDCEPHLELLVDLVLGGNFEVSTGAFDIIEGLEATPANIRRIRAKLLGYDAARPALPHHAEAFAALQELLAEHHP